MKTTVTIEIDHNEDDREELTHITRRIDYFIALSHIREIMRRYRRYVEMTDEQVEMFDKIDNDVLEILNEVTD